MWIRKGSTSIGDIIMNFDGTYFRSGSNRYGDIIACFDGHYFRAGSSLCYSPIIANLDHNGRWIRKGCDPNGEILLNIDGDFIREGSTTVAISSTILSSISVVPPKTKPLCARSRRIAVSVS